TSRSHSSNFPFGSKMSSNLFAEILDRQWVLDILLDHAPPATVFCIGRTCRTAQQAVQVYTRRVFNINTHLRRFVTKPKQLPMPPSSHRNRHITL
ncbi:hypothetical protein BD410DRAFT_790110, partial [Rickenella mellea]